jgi:hypothetical protein
MPSDELQRSWQITTQHLEAAKHNLPEELPNWVKSGPLLQYEEWLSHNELELAFDELEEIGHEIHCNQVFWSELLAAAENMRLLGHAERCRQQLVGS